MKNFDLLLRSGKTVFWYKNLSLLLGSNNDNMLKSYIARAVKQNLLAKVASGIYTLHQYDFLELAASVRPMSYISLEAALYGIRDDTSQISLISNNTLSKKIWNRDIVFFKIKDHILLNPLWLDYAGKYLIASPERALCDMAYLSWEWLPYLSQIDLKKLETISQIYNQTTKNIIKKYIDHAQNR